MGKSISADYSAWGAETPDSFALQEPTGTKAQGDQGGMENVILINPWVCLIVFALFSRKSFEEEKGYGGRLCLLVDISMWSSPSPTPCQQSIPTKEKPSREA